jgi:DNA-directed RNA polymerase specialized sigma24 family protein
MTEREQIKADIKRQLNSYTDLRAEHRELLEELAQMEITLGAPSGPNLDGMPRSPGVSNPVERAAVKHLALIEKCKAKLDQLAAALGQIEDLIEGLEPIERRLARAHYIDGLKWEDVCEKINYSWRQTHRIHGRMLDKLVAAELERRKAQK